MEFSQTVDLKLVEKDNPEIREGGRYAPKDCRALQKVAMIIPFRNRDEHLKYWLFYLHPILQRQQLDYGIYVINQVSHRDAIPPVSQVIESDVCCPILTDQVFDDSVVE